MTYEPGVLVRRQQREYPPELRREIATMALEVGNNREVARLYSERLGYTVNESTVRGIKKRYLEGVQKGKIESPGLSPRSGNESSNQGDRDSDAEGEAIIQPENCMRLQLDVLEGMKLILLLKTCPRESVKDLLLSTLRVAYEILVSAPCPTCLLQKCPYDWLTLSHFLKTFNPLL